MSAVSGRRAAAVALVALVGCPGPDDTNPTTFWLAPADGETREVLIGHDPGGF